MPLFSDEGARKTSSAIACLGIAFHLLSYYEEDCGHHAEVKVDADEGAITIVDLSGCCSDSIDAFRRSFGKIIGVPYRECEIDCSSDTASQGYRYRELSRNMTAMFLSKFRSTLTNLAVTGYEYFFIIGWNGEMAYGRGEETRIHLPLIPGVIMAHTHPSPLCYPSGHDLRSAAEFFLSSGLVEVIVSTSCVSVMRLVEPLREDDYWRLIDLSNKVKKIKEYEEYIVALNELSKLSSIVFEVF